MSKLPTIEQVEFLPGNRIQRRRLPHDLGVIEDVNRQRATLMMGPQASFRQGQRMVKLWGKSHHISAKFGNDGEGIDFLAGPDLDWRQEYEEWATENEEQNEAAMVRAADKVMEALASDAEIQALDRVYDKQQPNSHPFQLLVTLALFVGVTVTLMMLNSYASGRGGYGAVLGGG